MKLREERRDGRAVIHCEEAEWLAANRAWLEQEHAGEWVAVDGSRLLAVGPDLDEVMAEAAARGIDQPFVAGVKKKDYQDAVLVRSPIRVEP